MAPPRTRAELRAQLAAEKAGGPARFARSEPGDPGRSRLPRRFTVLLTLASLALLAWAGLCFVPTSQPEAVALTTLAPVLSVLALPVLAIGAARRLLVPVVLSLTAAAIPWILVAGSAAGGPGPTSATGHATLRVMTVDGRDGRASAPAIVRATRSFDVDVLVVTQLTSQLAHELTVAGITSMVTPRWVSIPAGQLAGAGLWSQQPIGETTPIPGFSQPSTMTTLTTDAGPVSLVVAQADSSSIVPGRRWGADMKAAGGVRALRAAGPRILAGDLGGTVWSPVFRQLSATGWHEAADVLGRGLRPTWPAWGPIPFAPLDQVMVGGGAGVSRADTVVIAGSTHRALLVSVLLPR